MGVTVIPTPLGTAITNSNLSCLKNKSNCMLKAKTRLPLSREPGFGSLDLDQIKGGRLCLYLLLDLDY